MPMSEASSWSGKKTSAWSSSRYSCTAVLKTSHVPLRFRELRLDEKRLMATDLDSPSLGVGCFLGRHTE